MKIIFNTDFRIQTTYLLIVFLLTFSNVNICVINISLNQSLINSNKNTFSVGNSQIKDNLNLKSKYSSTKDNKSNFILCLQLHKYLEYIGSLRDYIEKYNYIKRNINVLENLIDKVNDNLITYKNSNNSKIKLIKKETVNIITLIKKNLIENSIDVSINNSGKLTNLNKRITTESTTNMKLSFYDYYTYEDIMDFLEEVKNNDDYSDYVKISDAKEKFNLESPAGNCGDSNCKIPIITLGRSIKLNTPSILIVCGINGEEAYTTVACLEYIKLLLRNRNNSWVNYLLNNREITIVPLLNPSGFYLSRKEEYINTNINDNTIDETTNPSFIDISKDFPYLKSQAYLTQGSKVINKLVESNLYKIVITLKGKNTASITYPWLGPNHIKTTNLKIDSKLLDLYDEQASTSEIKPKIENFIKGKYDYLFNTTICSFQPPDSSLFTKISSSVSLFSSNYINVRIVINNLISDSSTTGTTGKAIEGVDYNKIIKFNDELFRKELYNSGRSSFFNVSERGDMDDWVYGINTEIDGVIVNKNIDFYDIKRLSHTKAAPFSLIISDKSSPSVEELGVYTFECILNTMHTPFYSYDLIDESIKKRLIKCYDLESYSSDNDKNNTTTTLYNGIIPKSLRSLLIFTDLAQPYINIKSSSIYSASNNYYTKIQFSIGGAISAQKCLVYYTNNDSLNDSFNQDFSENGNNYFTLKNVSRYSKSSETTSVKSNWSSSIGSGNDSRVYSINVSIDLNKSKFSYYAVVCYVNKEYNNEQISDIISFPITHLANEFQSYEYHSEINNDSIGKGKFIKGRDYVISNIDKLSH